MGLRPFGQPFARHDGGDAGRIDHERRGGDAAADRVDRQIVDVVANQIARGIARRHRDLRQVLGQELLRLERADVGAAEEAVHLGAEIAQPHAGIARRPALIEFGNHLFQQRVVVMQLLERDEAADQGAGLAGLDAGREQEQQRVEVVLFRDDAVLAQILRDDRRGNAVVGIGAGRMVEAGRQQRELVRDRSWQSPAPGPGKPCQAAPGARCQ